MNIAIIALGVTLAVLPAWAMAGNPRSTPTMPGDVERGKSLFNGKGICFYCHGRDGHVDQRPQLSPDTNAFVARLNPKPTDLRNPKSLKMKTDKERFRAIREGHEGTGMFPDSTLTDQEIRDTLAYLSVLRNASKDKP
jgi:mono/diheme cytochrome c family protein